MIISKNISHFSCHTAHLWLSLLWPSIPGTCGTTLTKGQNGLPVTRMPSAKKSLVQCHTWTSQGTCSLEALIIASVELWARMCLPTHGTEWPVVYIQYAKYVYILYTVYTYWLIKLALRGLRFRRWAFMRGHLCLDMHIHSQTKMIINIRTWKGYIYYIYTYIYLSLNVIMIHNVSKLSRTILIYPDSIG